MRRNGFVFFCVSVCECGCVSFGPWLIFHKLSGDKGENWTGITASQQRVPASHRETLPVLLEREGCVKDVHEGQR